MTAKEQLKALSQDALSLKPNSIYEHYKGKRYKIIAVGRHSETLEEHVIYQALYGDYSTWVRPLSMFVEKIEIEGKIIPRFKAI